MKKRTKYLLVFSLVFWGLVLGGLLLFGFSFTKIYVGQMALQQNIWNKIIQRSLTPGVYHRGLLSRSVTFPSTIQYIVYSETSGEYESYSANGPLTLISQDMQQFRMDYTLAYRIIYSTLQQTYTRFQDSFVSRMRTEVNNAIMSIMSQTDSKSIWLSSTEDQIKNAIYTRVQAMNTDNTKFYGTQIHGFWMSNFIFTTLEEYFKNAYVNSQSSSLSYKNSINSLNNINIQKSVLESTIMANIRNQNASYYNNFITGYNNVSIAAAQSKRNLAQAIKNISAANGANHSYLSFRNFTEFVFT